MKLYLAGYGPDVIEKIDFQNKKKAIFIPSAANAYEDNSFVNKSKETLESKGLEVTTYELEGKTYQETKEELEKYEIIYVAEGNVFYLLEKARESGLDRVINELRNKDVIYIGSSAGSVLVCPDIGFVSEMDDPKVAKALTDYKGLGLVDFHLLPHYCPGMFEKQAKSIYEKYSKKINIIPITDDQLILVEEGKHQIL